MEKRKILLADDTKLFLEIERTFLNRDSFELYTARTGKEALEQSLALHPHLILLSFTMPDISGDEICSVIKNDPGFSNTRVVIVTADYGEETLTRCIDAGCDGIITKPFDKEQLLETVQKLLGETFRQKPRYQVQIPCAIYLERAEVPGTILDISEIGCRVTTEDSLDEGAIVGIGFNLPDTDQPAHWNGIVRWTKTGAGDVDQHLLGIQLQDTPGDERQILQDILASLPDDTRL